MRVSEVASVVATVCSKMNRYEKSALIELLNRGDDIHGAVKRLVIIHCEKNSKAAKKGVDPVEFYESIFGFMKSSR